MDSAMRFAPFWQDFSRSQIDGSGQAFSFICPEFYWRCQREREEEKGGSSEARVAFSTSMSSLVLLLVLPSLPLSFPLILLLPTQVKIKYLKHTPTHGFWLSLIRRPPLFLSINPFLPFFVFNLYISSALFFSSLRQHLAFANSSIGEKPIIRRQEMRYIWQQFHSARLSLFTLTAYIFYDHSVSRVSAVNGTQGKIRRICFCFFFRNHS